MIDIPEKVKKLIYTDSVPKNYRIHFINSERADICNSELDKESVEITSTLCTEQILKFGSCNASQLKFTTYDTSNLEGCEVSVFLEIYCDSTIQGSIFREDLEHMVYPIPMGYFKIKSCVIDDQNKSKVTAYDAIYRLSGKNVFKWYNELKFPMTLQAFRESLAEYVGLEQRNDSLCNDDLIVQKTIYDTDINAVFVLSAICEINGVMAHIDRYGKLAYIPIDTKSSALYPSLTLYPRTTLYPGGIKEEFLIEKYLELECEDYISNAPDKLQISAGDGDIGAVAGTGSNMYKVTDNFLVYGKGAQELSEIAENLIGRIQGAEYKPIEANCIGNPALEVGDYVAFMREDGTEVYTFILERTLTGIQSLRDDLSAKGSKSYNYDRSTANSELLKLKQKTNKVVNTVEQYRREMSEIEEDLNGKYSYAISYVDMTATSLEAKIAEGNLEWEIGDLVISLYGYGDPPTELTVSYGGGSLYLDNTTGKVYEVESVSAVASFSGPTIYEYTWKFYRQLEKKETEYWTAINANAHAIELEAYQRQTAIKNEENARKESITELSSKITQTAESITSEVTARKNADAELQSQITQTAKDISAKVSSTGGDSSSFSWSLDANGFYLYSNGELVASFDKNSTLIKSIIKAEAGQFGITDGFVLNQYGMMISFNNVYCSWYNTSGNKIVGTQHKLVIAPGYIEMINVKGDGNVVGNAVYTYIGGGIIYSCKMEREHTRTEDAPWGFVGSNELIIKDGNIYIPNRTEKNGEVGNIYVQANATKQEDGTLKTGKYRRGMYSTFTVKDTSGTEHILRIRNGVIMSGLAEYDDPFYDGESIPE